MSKQYIKTRENPKIMTCTAAPYRESIPGLLCTRKLFPAADFLGVSVLSTDKSLAKTNVKLNREENQTLVGAIPFCGEYRGLGLTINFDQPIKLMEFQ